MSAADLEQDGRRSSDTSLSYLTLPHKGQLFVLALARFAEPVAQTSIFPYLYFLIQSFDFADHQVAVYAGLVASSFAFGQFLTGIFWGKLSDIYGRKPVLLCGLLGTMVSSIAFGFSSNIWMAILARTASGALNGNVGVLRTMVAELVPDKRDQTRAFTIMPMVFNIGSVLGPVIGGWLSQPAEKYGWTIWETYPFALPNLVVAVGLGLGFLGSVFWVRETLPESSAVRGRETYHPLPNDDEQMEEVKRPTIGTLMQGSIVNTMLSYMLIVYHNAITNQMLPVFLSTPRPVGLSLSTNQVGTALTIVGTLGIVFQLVLYPRIVAQIGTLNALRMSLVPSPFIYAILPFLPKIYAYWVIIILFLAIHTFTRTFAFPSCIILITNLAPPKGLGLTNGVAQALASFARCTGPLIAGAIFSSIGGNMWYCLVGISAIAFLQVWFIKPS